MVGYTKLGLVVHVKTNEFKNSKNREILATSAAGVVSRKGLTESGTK